MKQNGRRARKLAKERQERRILEEKRAGKPYSRVSKKKRICTHYETIGGGIIVGTGWSYLHPLTESKCYCSICKMEFSMEQYRAMEAFIKGYSGQSCTTVGKAHIQIQSIVPPVWYYRLDADTVKTIPFEEGHVALPRNFTGIL